MSIRRVLLGRGSWLRHATAASVLAGSLLAPRGAHGAIVGFGDGTGFTQQARDSTGSSSSPGLIRDGVLTLTEAVNGQTRSVFFTARQPTANWTANFRYRYGGGSGADGFAFVVQGWNPSILGAGRESSGLRLVVDEHWRPLQYRRRL